MQLGYPNFTFYCRSVDNDFHIFISKGVENRGSKKEVARAGIELMSLDLSLPIRALPGAGVAMPIAGVPIGVDPPGVMPPIIGVAPPGEAPPIFGVAPPGVIEPGVA